MTKNRGYQVFGSDFLYEPPVMHFSTRSSQRSKPIAKPGTRLRPTLPVNRPLITRPRIIAKGRIGDYRCEATGEVMT